MIRPRVGSYIFASSLTSVDLAGAVLADDGDDRAARQRQRDVVEDEPLAAGIGERHAIERDAVGEPVGRRSIGGRRERRGVVLEPREPPCAESIQKRRKPDFADGRADVVREPRARGEREQHVAGRRAEDRRHEDDRADVAGAEDRPRRGMPERGCPARRGDAAMPVLPGQAAIGDQPLADAGEPHFLARRRRRRHVEQVAREPVGLLAHARTRAVRRRAASRDVTNGGTANDRQQHERRMNRHQQCRA